MYPQILFRKYQINTRINLNHNKRWEISCTGTREIVCGGSEVLVTINCGHKIIKVTNSNFGRSAPYASMCPHPGGRNEELACTHSITDQLLPCDDRHQCQVKIVQPTSDPYYATGKYAEVDYICECELPTGVTTIPILVISCTRDGRFDGWCRNSWWRHEMKTFSALLAICAGNSPVTGEFPAHRPVTRSFDVFCDLRLSKRLSKQSWGCWFVTPSRPLWRHCNETVALIHVIMIEDKLTSWRLSICNVKINVEFR